VLLLYDDDADDNVKVIWWECQAASCGSRSAKHLQHSTHSAQSCHLQL